jgi:lactate racemase
VPGTASIDTIVQNHSLALDERSAPLALDRNPVHEDMVEAVGLLGGKEILSIQTVLDHRSTIAAATAGTLHDSFLGAVAVAERIYAVPVAHKTEVVVSVVQPPLDLDLYQAQKAIEHGRLALLDGGILIVVSACPDGIGEDAFHRTLSRYARPADLPSLDRRDYRLGDHKAQKLAALARKSSIWAVTTLPDDTVSACFMTPYHDVQRAVDDALALRPEASILVLPAGSVTVPKVKK